MQNYQYWFIRIVPKSSWSHMTKEGRSTEGTCRYSGSKAWQMQRLHRKLWMRLPGLQLIIVTWITILAVRLNFCWYVQNKKAYIGCNATHTLPNLIDCTNESRKTKFCKSHNIEWATICTNNLFTQLLNKF